MIWILKFKIYRQKQSKLICSQYEQPNIKDPSPLKPLFLWRTSNHLKELIIELIIRTMAEQNSQSYTIKPPHIVGALFENNLMDGSFKPKLAQNEQFKHQEYAVIPNKPLNEEWPPKMNNNQLDQIPFDHLNFANNHKFSHFFNTCLNPESQRQQKRNKMLHIEDMNKSVKQIMRCNQQYRGELLSAYQNKTKIQLENAILIKERQHLEDQKEIILAELEESRKKVLILENSICRLKQNHQKNNEKLKQDIDQLHKELNTLRNTKFDLQNKSNQNNLFLKTIQNHELNIRNLEQSLLKASNQSLQLKADLYTLREKFINVQIEKNRLILVSNDQKRTIQSLQTQARKNQLQNEDLNTKFKVLNRQNDNIRRQNQYERNRAQKLLNKLLQAERNHQERCRQLESSQNQFDNLMQAYLSIKSQQEVLKSLPYQLQTIKTINQSFSDQLTKRQHLLQSLNYAHAQQQQQIQQIRSQYDRLFCQFQTYKENAAMGAQNCIQAYENQIYSLKFGHQGQIKALSHTVHRLQQENDRLVTTLFKKQELIKNKEHQISRHLDTILQLQGNVSNLNKEKQYKISTILSKISELQARSQDKQTSIQSLQQTVKQLKTQNFQLVKKQIIKIAQKDHLIVSLEKEMTHTSLQSEKAIKKILIQQQQQSKSAQEREQSLKKQLQSSKQQIKASEDDILSLSQAVDSMKKQLQAKHTIISVTLNDNKRLQSVCENWKGQISVIEAEYDIIKNQLEQLSKQRHYFAQRLQNEQRKSQKLIRINQKYAIQIEQLKTKLHLAESKRVNAKRDYDHQISQLNQSLGIIRADHVRFRNIADSLDSIYNQINLIEQVQRTLMNDPKTSIGRFSHHITALHRQAFTREVEKINKYFLTINLIGEEVRRIVESLRLSVNAINKGFQVTFSDRKMNSTVILYEQ